MERFRKAGTKTTFSVVNMTGGAVDTTHTHTHTRTLQHRFILQMSSVFFEMHGPNVALRYNPQLC